MMLAMSAHPFGRRAYATRLGEVADFRIDATPGRDSSPELIFGKIFLPPSGSRFTPNPQATQFDNWRSAATLSICVEVRAQPMIDSHCYRRLNVSNLLCRGVRRIIVYAMLRQPI